MKNLINLILGNPRKAARFFWGQAWQALGFIAAALALVLGLVYGPMHRTEPKVLAVVESGDVGAMPSPTNNCSLPSGYCQAGDFWGNNLTITSSANFSGVRLQNVGAGSASTDATNLGQVQALIADAGSGSSGGCHTITDCDLTTQPSQTFAASGTVTLCGYATTQYVNSARAYQPSEISDAGLRLYPNVSTVFDPGAGTFDPPLFRIPLAALGVAPVNRIKVWVHASVNPGGAVDTSLWFGPEAPSIRFGSYGYFGKVSGLNAVGVVNYITGSSTIPSAVNYTTEDVFFSNVNGLWDQILSGGMGTWSGGWPSEGSLTPTGGAYPALSTRSGGNLISQTNGDVVLTTANYSGSGSVVATIKNIRIDVCN